MDNTLQTLRLKHLQQTGRLHMSGRNQDVMEQLHSAIDRLIVELGDNVARMELQGIVDEWEQK